MRSLFVSRLLFSALAAALLVLPMLPAGAVPTVVFPEAGAPSGPPLAITGASVISVEDGSVIQNAVVLIEGGRIKAIGPAGSVQLPADARKIARR
jgi:hypothetical protein